MLALTHLRELRVRSRRVTDIGLARLAELPDRVAWEGRYHAWLVGEALAVVERGGVVASLLERCAAAEAGLDLEGRSRRLHQQCQGFVGECQPACRIVAFESGQLDQQRHAFLARGGGELAFDLGHVAQR